MPASGDNNDDGERCSETMELLASLRSHHNCETFATYLKAGIKHSAQRSEAVSNFFSKLAAAVTIAVPDGSTVVAGSASVRSIGTALI